jgi:hypothetical protein
MTMASSPEAWLFRRYVLGRAAGRVPRREFARYDFDLNAWIRCDETTARESAHWRRLRKPAQPWCEVLGQQASIAADDALQAYFETVDPEGWSSLGRAVRQNSSRCFRAWSASGNRILDALSGTAVVSNVLAKGSLSGWPSSRGNGPRSLLSRS